MINGFDSITITKLDVLDQFAEIPVCVGYRIGGRETAGMPATSQAMQAVEPVYEKRPGWRTPTAGLRRYEDLPVSARQYLSFLEEQSCVEIGSISTGPERDQTIIVPGSKLERLLG
jgi:adenylosuccinate synthase